MAVYITKTKLNGLQKFLTRDRTLRKQKADELEAILGKGHIEYTHAHYILLFDENTPNIELLHGVYLHDFLTTSRRNRRSSRLDVKAILVLEAFWEEFGNRYIFPEEIDPHFVIKRAHENFIESRNRNAQERKDRAMGYIVDFALSTRSKRVVREFHKAIRRVGWFGYIRFDHNNIRINTSRVAQHEYV